MTDDLERRLRESLGSAPLPRAPEALGDYLANLSHDDAVPTASRRRAWGRPVLIGATAFLLLLVGLGTILLAGATRPAPTPSPSGPTGLRHFEAPGIAFDYPANWINQSVAGFPNVPGWRSVGLLARGSPVCIHPPGATATPIPGPTPTCQDGTGRESGSLALWVFQFTNPLPGAPFSGQEIARSRTTVAGRPAWYVNADGSGSDPRVRHWWVSAPDGSIYWLNALFPPQDQAARQRELEALIASLSLSEWRPSPPPEVNGHVHLDLAQGFSFDYPAGWTVYYPQDASAVVMVASRPLDPPCKNDSCQRFTMPQRTIAIEFRIGNGPAPPDWSKAPITFGGQPAFGPENWGPNNATGADEGHTWSVRLTDPSVLGIYVSLRGPNLPTLRAAMDEVLGSVRIEARQSPGP